MKTRTNGLLKTVAVLLASATLGIAQTSGNYNSQPQRPESVRPGSLNYVEGQVSSAGLILTPQSVGQFALQPGQSLNTGNGYAEILLTPGAFLRVGNNSELRLTAVGLANTRVDLVHGTAMIEVDQLVNGTQLTVGINNTSTDVLKRGLYSFDANQPAARVLDGKLKVNAAGRSRDIGRDDQILLAGNDMKKTGFDPSQARMDPLYVWSEARSRDEAGQNQLAYRNSSGFVPVGAGWFWDPYASYYGFWPSAYLYSPFGFGFYGGYYPGFYGGYYGARYGYPVGIHASISGFAHGSFGGGGRR
jgi:hypothetical protein